MTEARSIRISGSIGSGGLARAYSFDGAASATTSVSPLAADPTISYRRDGILKYVLFPNLSQLDIHSVGDQPHVHWQVNGNENFWRSMLFYNEQVFHFDLEPLPPAVPGENWDFAGPRGFTVEVNSAIMAGGEIHDQGATSASADFRVTSSNTFVFGADSSPERHFLFFGAPCDTHPPDFKPTVKRIGAKCTISCIRASDNRSLHEFRIPDSLYNNHRIQILPIQDILRQAFSGSLVGETIRVECSMTSFGQSDGREESKWVIAGAMYGFAVLPLVKR